MRVKVPFEISLSLRQGTVYYMADRNMTSSQSHYFIVLNAEPLEDKLLLLTVVTSQIEKVRKRRARKSLPEATVVEVMETEYEDFTKDCCVDCNTLIAKPIVELCQQWHRKEIRAQRDIPPVILEKLIEGILSSPLITDEDKERVSITP